MCKGTFNFPIPLPEHYCHLQVLLTRLLVPSSHLCSPFQQVDPWSEISSFPNICSEWYNFKHLMLRPWQRMSHPDVGLILLDTGQLFQSTLRTFPALGYNIGLLILTYLFADNFGKPCAYCCQKSQLLCKSNRGDATSRELLRNLKILKSC